VADGPLAVVGESAAAGAADAPRGQPLARPRQPPRGGGATPHGGARARAAAARGRRQARHRDGPNTCRRSASRNSPCSRWSARTGQRRDSLVARARAQVERAGLSDYASSALVLRRGRTHRGARGPRGCVPGGPEHACELLSRIDLSPWYEPSAGSRWPVPLCASATPRRRASCAGGGETHLKRSPDATVPQRWIADCQAQAEQSSATAHQEWSLTTAELRVLQFLPTHLSFPEIGRAAVRVSQHRQDARPLGLPEAGSLLPRRGRRAGARGRPARPGIARRRRKRRACRPSADSQIFHPNRARRRATVLLRFAPRDAPV